MFNILKDLNIGAVIYACFVIFFRKKLIQPDLYFDSINEINPEKLKQLGCRGVILDKDNTITYFYENELVPQLADRVNNFKRVFGNNLVILSNTASDTQINGILVLKRNFKKPFGIKSVRKYFNSLDNLAIIGDRIFTDIVFGNRYGLKTIYCTPLSLKGRSKIYKWIIKYERSLIKK